MPRTLMTVVGIGIALLLPGGASAQGLVPRNLSLAMANHCRGGTGRVQVGASTAAAVVDRAGQVLVRS